MQYHFTWDETRFTFDGDERIDSDLFRLSIQAADFLDRTLVGLKLDESEISASSKKLLIYLGARVHGASVAASMLLPQRLGREAIIIARCQFDYYLQMLYFDTYREKADDILKLLDEGAFAYRFWKRAKLDLSDRWSSAEIEKFESEYHKTADFNLTNEIRNRLLVDADFIKAAHDGNPFANGLLQHFEAQFPTHWTYGSSIVHASPADIPNVMSRQTDVDFVINVDSRMKAPNKTTADIAQRCFSAACLVRWRFGLSFDEEYTNWAERLTVVAKRHEREATDTRSMHD